MLKHLPIAKKTNKCPLHEVDSAGRECKTAQAQQTVLTVNTMGMLAIRQAELPSNLFNVIMANLLHFLSVSYEVCLLHLLAER